MYSTLTWLLLAVVLLLLVLLAILWLNGRRHNRSSFPLQQSIDCPKSLARSVSKCNCKQQHFSLKIFQTVTKYCSPFLFFAANLEMLCFHIYILYYILCTYSTVYFLLCKLLKLCAELKPTIFHSSPRDSIPCFLLSGYKLDVT